jgi:SAM-dependent methyltransferase
MSLQDQLVAQFRKPAGQVGQLAGWVMAHRPSNRLRNERTLDLLRLGRSETVLEIGYGPGFAIQLASRRVTAGKILGLDHSPTMYRQARRRNAQAIAEGRVELMVGDVLDPPSPLPAVDKIYSVNVVQFWPDLEPVFAEFRRLLNPGGSVATTFMPRVGSEKPGQARAHAKRLQRVLQAVQFSAHRVHWLAMGATPAVCVIARK